MFRSLESVKKTIEDMATGKADEAMKGEFVSYDDDARELVMRFPVLDWELNSKDVVHGMVTCGWLDTVMGALSNDVDHEVFAPTGSMYVNFITAVPEKENVLVSARVLTHGKRLIRLRAEARIESSGQLAADTEGVYIPVTYRPSDAMKAQEAHSSAV
ncbi:MAG: PaaI family thioesterase [Anaerovoracaceae bacterium]|jgi:acyl-coenzyme A thioesterase PaaI-like protein